MTDWMWSKTRELFEQNLEVLSQMRPFPPMPELMAIAEDVTKVRAVCAVCGEPASRSQRIVGESTTVLVGGAESYEARCRKCFQPREVAKAEPVEV